MTSAFAERFSGLCDRAQQRGLLVGTDLQPMASSSDSSSSTIPAGAQSPGVVRVSPQVDGGDDAAARAAAAAEAERRAAEARMGTPSSSLVTVLDSKAREFTPGIHVVERALAIFELAFGTTSLREEHAFNTLQQGTMTLDNFAHELLRRKRALGHKNSKYNDEYCLQRFLLGLSDKACAQAVASMLRSHTRAEKNVMLGLHCAQLWEEEQQLEQLVLLETQVAARLAAAKAGTSYRGSSSSHPRGFSQQATAPRPAAPRPMPQQQDPCRFCKGGHPSSACYYDKPNRAARWWTPSNPDPELQRHYRARCQELGIPVMQQGAREPQQRDGRVPAVGAAAVFHGLAAAAEQEAAGAYQQDQLFGDEGSLDDWNIAGSCMFEQDFKFNFAAGAETRSKASRQQPLSFVPPANLQPRTRSTRKR
ncbi:hypothetical protein COO60DRAFT_1656495 [Scenedesmus sp. NREL 46B-D3]|nr:hypothetical protein COO60DRAFT_1656495 [Scenedesmus sp. NREL 46B-D3]